MKWNLSSIMKEAWNLYKNSRNGGWCACTYPSFSKCLKDAWAMAKTRARMDALEIEARKKLDYLFVEAEGLDSKKYEGSVDWLYISPRDAFIRKVQKMIAELGRKVFALTDKSEIETAKAERNVLIALKHIVSGKPNRNWIFDLGPIPEEVY